MRRHSGSSCTFNHRRYYLSLFTLICMLIIGLAGAEEQSQENETASNSDSKPYKEETVEFPEEKW